MENGKVGSDAKAAAGVALALAVIATLIDSAAIGWLVAPVVIGLIWFAMSRAPLKSSLFALMFFALTLENPSEMPAAGAWKSPLYNLGGLVLRHLNKSTGIGALSFSGMDLLLASLGVIAFMRRKRRARDVLPTPKPLVQLAQLSLAGTLFVWFYGVVVRGGDNSISLWQIDRVMYIPLVFLLFHLGLQSAQDFQGVARVVLAAATLRAAQAMYVQAVVVVPPDPDTGNTMLAYATSHHDSMLFAWAFVILVAFVLQRAGRRALKLTLLLTPVLVGGMIANQRRMVWVQVILVFVALYFSTPPNLMKRRIALAFKIMSPVTLAYVLIGWESKAPIFKPVQTIRSAVDSQTDTSTMWRDIENFDLIYTMRQQPIFGTGYGHGFTEMMPLPNVDYPLERYIPHNSLLGLLTYGGYVGFGLMTLLWVAGAYFALRAYHAARNPPEKVAALAAFGAVPIYYLQCYGDMGLGSWTGVFMMAPALAVAGKLAVHTNAWPLKVAKTVPAAAQRAQTASSTSPPAPIPS